MLSVEEIESCRQAFNTFDKDGTKVYVRARRPTRRDPLGCRWIACTGPKSVADTDALFFVLHCVRLGVAGSGTIDANELKATLQALGQNPSEEELFLMISQVDEDNSGEIEFAEFLKCIENQKAKSENASDESETVAAFVALGGQVRSREHRDGSEVE